ncbi:hypothetical protein TeGR_g10883, partial [Tetraparma gracilis]
LLALMLDFLETLPPTPRHNYDFVLLQATDNSVGFYEAMGFRRVGAVQGAPEKGAEDGGGKAPPDDREIATSPHITYRTQGARYETPKGVATSHEVDVNDLLFLNKPLYPGMQQSSRLRKNTALNIPDKSALPRLQEREEDKEGMWYRSDEDETPKDISLKFNVDVKELVAANKRRLKGLLPHSKLQHDTKVQVSRFDDPHYVPYVHWAFPDDDLESSVPSYMMARRLNRRTRGNPETPNPNLDEKIAGILAKIVCPVVKSADKPPPPSPAKKKPRPLPTIVEPLSDDAPAQPKKPANAFILFSGSIRERVMEENPDLGFGDIGKLLGRKW